MILFLDQRCLWAAFFIKSYTEAHRTSNYCRALWQLINRHVYITPELSMSVSTHYETILFTLYVSGDMEIQ